MGVFSKITSFKSRAKKKAEERLARNLEGLAQRCEEKLTPYGYTLDSFTHGSIYRINLLLCHEVELKIRDDQGRLCTIKVKQPNILEDFFSGFGYQHPEINYYDEQQYLVDIVFAFAKSDPFDLKESMPRNFQRTYDHKQISRTSPLSMEGCLKSKRSMRYRFDFSIELDERFLEESPRKNEGVPSCAEDGNEEEAVELSARGARFGRDS